MQENVNERLTAYAVLLIWWQTTAMAREVTPGVLGPALLTISTSSQILINFNNSFITSFYS